MKFASVRQKPFTSGVQTQFAWVMPALVSSLLLISVLSAAPCLATDLRKIETLPLVKSAEGFSVDIVKESYNHPVIVIRFLGSLCSHCMQQIVALNEKAPVLKSINVRVIAFSNNPPEKCAEVARNYHIDTSVISICSDADNACSKVIGTTILERDNSITDLHAFIVIDKGLVLREHYSTTPLMSFQSIIEELSARRQ
jgi:peroxiredoxin